MPDASETPRLGRRPALDGLRGLAVLLVVCVHVGLLAGGYIGVDVFLPLSGFLITTLLYEEWDRTGDLSLRRFYERRVRRLLPALLVVTGAFVLVMVTLDPFPGLWPLGRISASTLLFMNNWVATLAPGHSNVLGALGPTWTLAQEGQFYLLWPPVLWLLLRSGLAPRAVLAALVAMIALLLGAEQYVAHAASGFNAYTSPFDRGAELLLGAAAAVVWRERLVPAPLRRAPVAWVLIAALGYLAVTADISSPTVYLAAAALSALLVMNLLSGAGRLAHLLAWRPLAYLGKVSYGVYLWHLPIYYLLWTYHKLGSPYLYAPVVSGLSVAAATLSWRLVESPAMRLRLSAFGRLLTPTRAEPIRHHVADAG